MKYLKQFGIILVLSFIGELLNHVLPLPVPSSIYGIILMFICLKTGLIPLEEVDETGRFLIEIMPLMFIPAGVGLLESWGDLRHGISFNLYGFSILLSLLYLRYLLWQLQEELPSI